MLVYKLTFTIVKLILNIQGVPINMVIERRLQSLIDFWYLMHGNELLIKWFIYIVYTPFLMS